MLEVSFKTVLDLVVHPVYKNRGVCVCVCVCACLCYEYNQLLHMNMEGIPHMVDQP
jgi:hypothetical protein